MVSLTDELGLQLNKIRDRYKNPINNKPCSYSYAIAMALKKNKRLLRKLKELREENKNIGLMEAETKKLKEEVELLEAEIKEYES